MAEVRHHAEPKPDTLLMWRAAKPIGEILPFGEGAVVDGDVVDAEEVEDEGVGGSGYRGELPSGTYTFQW